MPAVSEVRVARRRLPNAMQSQEALSNTAKFVVTRRAVIDPTIPFGEDIPPHTKNDIGGFVLVVGDGGPGCEVAVLSSCESFASVIQQAVVRKFQQTGSAKEAVCWLRESSRFAGCESVEYPGFSLIY